MRLLLQYEIIVLDPDHCYADPLTSLELLNYDLSLAMRLLLQHEIIAPDPDHCYADPLTSLELLDYNLTLALKSFTWIQGADTIVWLAIANAAKEAQTGLFW